MSLDVIRCTQFMSKNLNLESSGSGSPLCHVEKTSVKQWIYLT